MIPDSKNAEEGLGEGLTMLIQGYPTRPADQSLIINHHQSTIPSEVRFPQPRRKIY